MNRELIEGERVRRGLTPLKRANRWGTSCWRRWSESEFMAKTWVTLLDMLSSIMAPICTNFCFHIFFVKRNKSKHQSNKQLYTHTHTHREKDRPVNGESGRRFQLRRQPYRQKFPQDRTVVIFSLAPFPPPTWLSSGGVVLFVPSPPFFRRTD